MVTAAVSKSLFVARILPHPPGQRSRVSFLACNKWHHGHTGFESTETQSELWKYQRGSNKDGCPVSVSTQAEAPVVKEYRMAYYLP
jgi:hypothetical protein